MGAAELGCRHCHLRELGGPADLARIRAPADRGAARCLYPRLAFSWQHEAIHGWRSLVIWRRTGIVWSPWWPFELCKRSHSRHHRNTHLTYPGEDTQTQHHQQEDWSGYTPAFRVLLLFNQTLPGRLTVGPVLRLRRLVIIERGKLARGDFPDVPAWLGFFGGLAVVLGLSPRSRICQSGITILLGGPSDLTRRLGQ